MGSVKPVATLAGTLERLVQTRGWRLAALAGFAALAVDMALGPFRVNHDCAYIIEGARRMLDGQRLYVDFIDSNPPLIYYLFLVPVQAARTLGASPILLFSLFVLALAGLSGFFLDRLLTPAAGSAAASSVLVAWVASLAYVWRANDLGQREHLFILLYLPFLVTRWCRGQGRSPGRPLAVAVGVLAAVGLALKPHFLVVGLAVELHDWLRARRMTNLKSPEVLAAVATGLVYGLHFLFLPRVETESFFHRLVPLHLKAYHVYNSPLSTLLDFDLDFPFVKLNLLVFALIVLALPFLWKPRQPTPLWSLARSLAVATAACLYVYFVQQKGWSYHAIPVLTCGLAVLAVAGHEVAAIIAASDSWRRAAALRRIAHPVVAALVVLALVGWSAGRIAAGPRPMPENELTAIVAAHSRPGDAVAFISTSVFPAYPMLLQMDRRLGSRHPCNLPLALVRGLGPANRDLAQREEERYLAELAEDFARYRPRLIFIDNDNTSQGVEGPFNVLGYLESKGFLDHAMAGYRPVAVVPGFTAFAPADPNRP